MRSSLLQVEKQLLGISRGFFGRNHEKVTRRFRYQSQTSDFEIRLDGGKLVRSIYFAERAGNAVLGGLRIGLTPKGSEVLAASPVEAKSLTSYPPKTGALSREEQRLYISAAQAWNGSVVDCVIEYDVVPYE